MTKPLRIGIVAGEISGDILGAGFIEAVKAQYPDAEFIGVAGPRMQAAGCQALFDMEELAVMGIVEVLGRLPRLFKIKAELVRYFTDNPPDVFVGIDAPDFNLRLERDLKDHGIKTVHYVSPSVWAWRQKRIFKIEKATNLVLAFLPFEKAFYDKFNVPCEFIGHTMADAIPFETDKLAARQLLNLDPNQRYLAVLPGSRGGEMELIAPPFIETCRLLKQQHPDLGFVVALVNQKRREQFEQAWQSIAPELDFVLVDDTARNVMIASDAVLLASGTVALECMLVKRPMVVGYKVKPLTAWLAKRMLKTKYVSLPNILADKELVPELLQEECEPVKLAEQVNRFLAQDNSDLIAEFNQMHQWIRCDADKQAAQAVLKLIDKA
ncbi:TPA: lipid-A-disaccharide synthase [Photobacterium damselae]|uniref:lipid-A-disaccharide synthase n=1 Tax=Photobacterium damselae TaxID=38293 RepID=UPI000D0693DB|nr:lipid-A-disaccharide synthase [Photobacterium damselae]PSB76302.1 lipid-A-disaccharide synthase [Photobacterium damselae subsp. damselae]PSB88992.1 lipid-A-disaccharide synthase [Photobacterium damselae subsp. damselae]UKA25911.1 lipid-A-disaccharide synthase [Photobacterium damselae subsp. damselae]UKA29752.1 lipid-A-disaccharide synthase [Photobacterium damselae subsp. damselae]USR76767.1 lipid-A-disaccharide synthase [Photobacterium damselae]